MQAAGETAAQRRKAVTDTLKELELPEGRCREGHAAPASAACRAQDHAESLLARERRLRPAHSRLSSICRFLRSGSRQFVAFAAGLVGHVRRAALVRLQAHQAAPEQVHSELANAIEIIVRGVKSGLPLNECLVTIARESAEPLASEFREVVEQQRVGVSLGEALERMTTRMPLAEVRFLTIVIAIQQQAGGNLSEALGNLADVLRDRFQLRMKVKALSAEAKASALVLASLPPASCSWSTAPRPTTSCRCSTRARATS